MDKALNQKLSTPALFPGFDLTVWVRCRNTRGLDETGKFKKECHSLIAAPAYLRSNGETKTLQLALGKLKR